MGNIESKKIIILGSAWPLRGGLAAYNERLARAFSEAGHDVRLYNFSLQYPSFLFPGKTQYSEAKAPQNIKITTVVNSINPLNWFKVARMIRSESPDLIITKFWIPFIAPSLGTIARRVKRNKKTVVISILDNVIPHEKRPGDSLLINYFLNSVDGFVAMSKSVETDLKSFKPKAACLLNPHPLYDNFGEIMSRNQALNQLGLDDGYKYLLFFGFIREYKGLDLLLQAMNNEKIKNLNVKLIVAGEFYTDSAPYLRQIEEYGIGERVILATDFIPDDKVGVYFSACDLVVQPYKSATQSGVTQIAYHFEKPMVVTDVGGLSEIVPHGKAGYVVNLNADDIAEAISDFFEQNLAEEMKTGVKDEKKKYSWDEMLNTIFELYRIIKNNKTKLNDCQK